MWWACTMVVFLGTASPLLLRYLWSVHICTRCIRVFGRLDQVGGLLKLWILNDRHQRATVRPENKILCPPCPRHSRSHNTFVLGTLVGAYKHAVDSSHVRQKLVQRLPEKWVTGQCDLLNKELLRSPSMHHLVCACQNLFFPSNTSVSPLH